MEWKDKKEGDFIGEKLSTLACFTSAHVLLATSACIYLYIRGNGEYVSDGS